MTGEMEMQSSVWEKEKIGTQRKDIHILIMLAKL